ncbi:MAG TPA: AsmA family protein [Bryobacteraceae bacterium]|nr:AsmA family protein [Bryobacteraceae bacterium]
MTEPRERTSAARYAWGFLLTLVAVVVAIGLIAPWIDATRFSGPIQRSVEDSLGRKIQFSGAHLTLFSGPGFVLDNVSIAEDPRYGVEPFAWVPYLDARLRPDKLLRGEIRLASLRLEDPALNLVQGSDGTWNIVELVQRLTAPRRMPLNLFPTFEVSDGRIDFKFGERKTTFYLLGSDLSIYPERSGKLLVQFSGSPARTDRAGNGFGHFRGSATWTRNAPGQDANQFQADLTLDPSNLSELTTLVEGQDAGVHGSISGHARVSGPIAALKITGDVRLGDVHRWDLMPASGEDWRVAYDGTMDWAAHHIGVHTTTHSGDASPIVLELDVRNYLTRPDWSLVAKLDHAPADKLLPLSRRMGLSLPEGLKLTGEANGNIGYSSGSGLNGTVSISNATATLPDLAPLRTNLVTATIFPDRIRFDRTSIDTTEGSLQAGGEYFFSGLQSVAKLNAMGFSVPALKSAVSAWFGAPGCLDVLKDGRIGGSLTYVHQPPATPAWSGELAFNDATLQLQGMSMPLTAANGQVAFDNTDLEISRFSSKLGHSDIHGSYRYTENAKRTERLRVDIGSADLSDLEKALEPALTPQNLLARLRVTNRQIPKWLAARNMEGDVAVDSFSIAGTQLGAMNTHFVWQGAKLQLSPVQIALPEGFIRGRGSVNLASYVPRSRFTAQVSGFPWRGGNISADGSFATAGLGSDTLQNLRATGTFSGSDVSLSPDDDFSKISGEFDISFDNGWPFLKLSSIQASDGLEAWSGTAITQSDGKLIIDLEHAGHQRHVVSTLLPETTASVSSIAPPNRREPIQGLVATVR